MRKSFTYSGKRYYISGKDTKEIKQKIEAKKKELNNIYYFTEWVEKFLDVYKSNVAEDTVYNYKMRIKRFLYPFLADKKLNEITPLDCQQVFSRMSGYSDNYVHKVYHDLFQILDKALLNGFITANPVIGVILPKGGSKHFRTLTKMEKNVIMTVGLKSDFIVFILLMLMCGLRPHETSYIQGKDIIGNILHIRGTKTIDADRYVPIPDLLFNLIPKLTPEEYLIKSINGKAPITKANRVKMWNKFKTECGLDSTDLSMYCLRHTYCTDLRDAGVPITIAKEFMGHSTIKLTADIYTHKLISSSDEDAQKIAARYLHTYLNR